MLVVNAIILQEIYSIMELVGPIIDVLKCLGDPTCRYIDHHRKLEKRMKELGEREDDLNTLRRDIELKIKAELRWGKILSGEVEKWLLEVQEVNKKIQAMYQRAQNVSCFSRACLGKRVAEIIELVQKTIERGKFTGALVIDNPSTAGVAFQLEHLEGENSVKEQIWNYLMGDEIGMIAVCGMGGIGKTTVMKHIYNQLLKKNKDRFPNVIWVTVSKELDTTKVQQVIANALNIASLPEPEQERERAAVLMEELGKGGYVLILDDVWKKFSLLELGIPQPTSTNGSKLVLTSRSIDVCTSMGYKIVKVQPLSNEESMNLFLEHVGRGVLEVPSLKEILGHIVQECDGLPLAIVVLAGSMKGIDDDREWRHALTELRQHKRTVKGTEEEIYKRLKFSYDRLGNSQIQNCFLYCSLYPEDFVISRAELIEYWIDDGFLGIGSRQDLYDGGHVILNMLENKCLLEKVDDGNVKMHDVLRDMALYIKDRSRFMVKAGLGLRELPSKQEWAADLEKVSLMRNDISEFPPDLSPNCKILSTLLLRENKNLQRIPEVFFQHMHGLCILDLSYTNIEQLPDSVSNLEKLNALVLFGCYKLRYVPSLEKLKALRKLDLCYTAIEKVPDGLEMLVNLTYLNLYAECLKELPIAILPKLSCLQYLVLYVESSTLKINGSEAARLTKLEMFEGRFNELMDFNRYSKSIQGQRRTSYLLVMAPFKAKFDATTLEVERSSLTYVFRLVFSHVCRVCRSKALKIVATIRGTESVALEGADKELIRVVGVLDPIEIVKKLAKIGVKAVHLQLPYHQKDVILSGCPIGREDSVVLPSDLRCLRIFECHNVRSLSDISFFQQTNELRFCSIHDCRRIESVLDLSSSPSPCTPFQNLELLWLENLDNLHMLVKVGEACVVPISSSLPRPGIFSHLKSFQIEGCSNMKQLFPFELVHDLQNMEKLVIGNCRQMEEIIASEEEEENHKGKGTYSATTFTFPKLRKFKLKKLPKLKSICSSNRKMTCDSLQVIKVWKCPNLKKMPLYLPLFQDTDQQSSHPFKRIRIYPKEWWKSVEWDYPSAKNVLQPWLVLG
ncbi:putative disease resistance protein At4g10780 [Durio zibethinus]|uniref:Disease resistance protein At4g10780 n=1 Tax=Durio zibethinus TaxID=66656 RepID=A0A6P5YXL5_DURZI|nr:putative disease resistance protein At4g10780 [Durio zibethinus]